MSARAALILLTIIVIAAGSTQAAGKLGFGVKAGLSFASADFDYTPPIANVDPGWRNGFLIGVFADYPLTPCFSLRPEALFVQKGSKISVEETTEAYPDGTGDFFEVFNRTDYVSLQLLAKAKIPRPGPSPYLMAGPRMDIKVRADSDDPNYPVGEAKATIFGGTAGGGFGIPVGPVTTLMIEFEYFLDFGDAVNYTFENAGETKNITVTNRGCAVSVGLMF